MGTETIGRYRAKPSRAWFFCDPGKDAWVDGIPATPSDVDALLTDTGYSLMALGHQNQYDLF